MLLSQDSKNKILIAILFLIAYYLIFGFTSFASGFIHQRMTLAFAFEYYIPFYPVWSIVYMSINLYLLAALFILKKWESLASFAITLLIETAIAGVLFIIFPMKLIYAPATSNNAFVSILYIAKFFSMNNNYFPSLHTAFAFTAAMIYSKDCNKLYKILFFIWAMSIPVSTLFIHEHQIIDLIAGFLLALIAYHYILPAISNWLIIISNRRRSSLWVEESAEKISN